MLQAFTSRAESHIHSHNEQVLEKYPTSTMPSVVSEARARGVTVPALDQIQESVDEYLEKILSQRHTDPAESDDEDDAGDVEHDARLAALWRGLTARMAADPALPKGTKKRSRSSESVDVLRRAAARLRPGARTERRKRASRLRPVAGKLQSSAQKLDGEQDINAGAWLRPKGRRSSSEMPSSDCETPRSLSERPSGGCETPRSATTTASMASLDLTSGSERTTASSAKTSSGGSARSSTAERRSGHSLSSFFCSRKSHRPATAFASGPSKKSIDC